jgi:hypothetical protein
MYFADLTPYCYRLPFSLHSVECVGWLDSLHPYAQGRVLADVVERLSAIIQRRNSIFDAHVNVVRGVHPCNFCGDDVSIVDHSGRRALLGISELRLPFQAGYVAAPSLVLHYIAEHHYCPPDSFVRAIFDVSLDKPFSGQSVYDDLVAKAMTRTTATPPL